MTTLDISSNTAVTKGHDYVSLTWHRSARIWLLFQRPYGPAGQFGAEVRPGVRLAVDAFWPETPLSMTVVGDEDGVGDTESISLVRLVFGDAAAEALASGHEGAVDCAPAATAQPKRRALFFAVELLGGRPTALAAADAALLAAKGGPELDPVARTAMGHVAPLLSLLPPLDALTRYAEEQVNNDGATALRRLAGLAATLLEAQSAFFAGAQVDDVALFDVPDQVPDWDRSLVGSGSRGARATRSLAFRGPESSSGHHLEVEEIGCRVPRADYFPTQRYATVEVEMDHAPCGTALVVVVNPEGICTARQRIEPEFDPATGLWRWQGKVYVHRPNSRVRVLAGVTGTDLDSETDAFERAVQQGLDVRAMLAKLLRRRDTTPGHWTAAGTHCEELATRWGDLGDAERQAQAIEMAIACFKRSGTKDVHRIENLEPRLAALGGPRHRPPLTDPAHLPPLALCDVLSPLLVDWAGDEIAALTGGPVTNGNPGNRGEQVAAALDRAVLLLADGEAPAERRAQAATLAALVLVVLGRTGQAMWLLGTLENNLGERLEPGRMAAVRSLVQAKS